MYFLLSGEGVTDLGSGRKETTICEGEDFVVGPMAVIADRIVEARYHFSILVGACGFVSESSLTRRAIELKAKKELRLPGKKRAKETGYFFYNARILSIVAKEKSAEINDEVVAILFRDADGTASAGRGEWTAKRQSMLDGFNQEGFFKGVPMIPKPKSEAWLICAFKKQTYRECELLEDRSGNDRSPNSLKAELLKLLGHAITPEFLCEEVRNRFDVDRIKMPSFTEFRERLLEVI